MTLMLYGSHPLVDEWCRLLELSLLSRGKVTDDGSSTTLVMGRAPSDDTLMPPSRISVDMLDSLIVVGFRTPFDSGDTGFVDLL